MNSSQEKTLVCWRVRCIDRRTTEYSDRMLVLDWAAMSPDEEKEMHAILAGRGTDLRVLNFRKFFTEVTDHEVQRLSSSFAVGTFVNGLLRGVRYFEDDAGNPLNEVGSKEIGPGRDFAFLGDVRGVLRLGPSPVKDKADWTVEKADDIAHFLHLVDQIRDSKWRGQDLKITFQGTKVLEFKQAEKESTRSFLALLRQLLMPRRLDDVLNVACEAYCKHVTNPVKAAWVQREQKGFRDARKHVPFPFQLGTHTMEEVIDMMIYGAGLAHRKSRDKWEEKLPGILAQYGQERFLFIFHGSCNILLDFAFRVAPVIDKDFQHWIANEGCCGPNRVLHGNLFD